MTRGFTTRNIASCDELAKALNCCPFHRNGDSVIPATQNVSGHKKARPPMLRATSEARGKRAATANADTLSVEDASPVELARVMATSRNSEFNSQQHHQCTDPAAPPRPGTGGREVKNAPQTKLQAYLDRERIPAAWVEKEGRFARETFRRWRLGEVEMRRKQMVRVLGALQRITKKPIRMEEIFDLDPLNPENWVD